MDKVIHTPPPGPTAIELGLWATKTAGLSMTLCTQHESDSPNQTNRLTPHPGPLHDGVPLSPQRGEGRVEG